MKNTCLLILALLPFALAAQWHAIDGPSGGGVYNLHNTGTSILAGTEGGLYRSTDNGNTWQANLEAPLNRTSAFTLVGDGQNAVARINENVLITTNGGESWNTITIPAAANGFRGVVFNGQVMIYRSITNAYISFDAGQNWDFLSVSLSVVPSEIYVYDHLLYVKTSTGQLHRSLDPEVSGWETIEIPFSSTFPTRFLIQGDTLLAGLLGSEVQYSHDGGENWTAATGITEFGVDNEGFWSAGNTFFALNNNVLFQSTDGGIAWTPMEGVGNNVSDVLSIGNELLILRLSQPYRTPQDNLDLSLSNEGIYAQSIYNWQPHGTGLTYHQSGGLLNHAQLADGGIFIDSTYASSSSALNIDEMLTAPDGSIYYIEDDLSPGNFHDIYRISPTGQTTFIRSIGNQPWLNSDLLRYADGKLIYIGNGVTEFSEDNGVTWQPNSNLLSGIGFSDYVRHENAVYALTNVGVHRKTDGETDWTIVDNGINLATLPMGSSQRAGRLVSTEGALFAFVSRQAATTYDVYVTHDGGENWQETALDIPAITYPTPNNAPPGIEEVVSLGGYHFMAARNVGVAISNDQGRNWVVYNDGLPTDRVEELHVVNGKVVISTYRSGFWQLDPADIQLQQVTGRVFFDENANGVQNASEAGLANVKLLLANGEDLSFTNTEGTYTLFFRNDGDYQPVLNSTYFTSVPGSRNTDDSGMLDFALQLTSEVNDLRVSLTSDNLHRPGFDTRYYLHYENLALTSSNVTLQLDHDPALLYNSATTSPSQVAANTLSFELGDLPPLASGVIAISFTVDQSAELGSMVSSTATISAAETDLVSENNVDVLTDVLVGSYDPNDIQVDYEVITPSQVNVRQVLRYRIRFQNTGTYFAERVVVRNFIEAKLNLGSIANVAASHDFEIEVEGDRNLAFVFNGINLPDSTRDEANSHGFITYEIAVNDELNTGDSIKNQAAIYFDFNLPIITNYAVTMVEMPSSIAEHTPQLRGVLAPNPAVEGLAVRLITDAGVGTLSVYDQLGRLVHQQAMFDANQDVVTTRGFKGGVYFIQLVTKEGQFAAKLVIE